MVETVKNNPLIKEVYFTRNGSYSFNKYTDLKGKEYTRNGEGEGKFRVFDPQFLIEKTVSRDEILGIVSEPKKEPVKVKEDEPVQETKKGKRK